MTNFEDFKIWERHCNEFMLKKYGLGIDDIPDMQWRDWFELDQYTPSQAVEKAIEVVNEGGF